ncbi:phosphatidylglycerophosphatase A family protein [Polycyclovorans algicola]|uniref:phosphatidylglycerophosphatase A family protein n=1 Tax=Polycyclovorans algicola TaxID=616992 RepID=UPI0006942605
MQPSDPRPPARTILTSPVHLLAFGLGSGLSPKAPGTVGTLAAVPFAWVMLQWPLGWALGVIVMAALLGIYLCGESARRLGVHDHGGIVFDEFVGYWISCLPLMPAVLGLSGFAGSEALGLLLAFALFRFFDVLKPWPISWLDRHVDGGLGIMVDDLLAGLFAAVAFIAGSRAWHALL